MGGEMNSEEGLRALESLHARLCVLERAYAKPLGPHYPTQVDKAINEIFFAASVPIDRAKGNLSSKELRDVVQEVYRLRSQHIDAIRANQDYVIKELKNKIAMRTMGGPQDEYENIGRQLNYVFKEAYLIPR